ncbi:NAD(P)/FAD-dependent oxidoreductase [Actinoalloteichus caeruleus]|uniref:NAD(P)/FAD-dependent oxidoreductase n=1 Tax=Actinoalloteichus cyanogriseus TaxID=2893586 RepID=UPI003BB956B0
MAPDTTEDVDLVVVGAGPVGLYAAYYAGFRELTVAVVDSLPEPGGQVTAMYPEKLIYDVAGFPEVRGRDLVEALVAQANRWNPTYLLGRQARTVTDREDGRVDVGLGDGAVVRASAVLVTAGMGEFRPRPLPAGEGWLGRGVVHFVPRLAAHTGERVLVVGGGDSAFDWAAALHPFAAEVTLAHRRSRFRAHPASVTRVRDLGIPVLTEVEVAGLVEGDGGELRAAELRSSDGSTRELPVDTVVAALGFLADLGPVAEWGLRLDKRMIGVDSTMRTSRDRVYAAGDIAGYRGKVKLIATGFGEAATAVNNIAVLLDPEAHLFPGHSSDGG